jgi:serine/threonine protein kinase
MTDAPLNELVLGRYRIVRDIAVGGMGKIQLARTEGAAGFAKPVVVKRILDDGLEAKSDAEKFFISEAKILAQLRHPGIVSVLDFARERGGYIMVLEYVHGYHLGNWVRYHRTLGQPFPAEVAIHVTCQVLDALAYAHTLRTPDGALARIVHCDVTPSNVLIDIEGHVKLADFGIARIQKSEDDRTSSGMVRGKTPYLAPEMLKGVTASPLSDVYSTAVLLHETLAGVNEFRGGTPAITVHRVLEHIPSKIEAKRTDVPRGLDAVLAKGLAKEPQLRYQSAEAFQEGLRALLRGSEKELDRGLAAAVKRDFIDRIPATLQIERLQVYDDAWRKFELPEGRISSVPPPSRTTLAPPSRRKEPPADNTARIDTKPNPVESVTGTMEPRRLTPGMIVALVLFGLSILGGAFGIAWFVSQKTPPPSGPRYLVVEANPDEVPDENPDVAAVEDASTNVVAPTTPAGRTRDASTATTPRQPQEPAAQGGEGGLTRAFASRRPAILECFRTQAEGLSGAPRVDIRFTVAASGQVTDVSLSPSSLAGTGLGGCITRVARGTTFPPQAGTVRFVIPVTATSRPR